MATEHVGLPIQDVCMLLLILGIKKEIVFSQGENSGAAMVWCFVVVKGNFVFLWS